MFKKVDHIVIKNAKDIKFVLGGSEENNKHLFDTYMADAKHLKKIQKKRSGNLIELDFSGFTMNQTVKLCYKKATKITFVNSKGYIYDLAHDSTIIEVNFVNSDFRLRKVFKKRLNINLIDSSEVVFKHSIVNLLIMNCDRSRLYGEDVLADTVYAISQNYSHIYFKENSYFLNCAHVTSTYSSLFQANVVNSIKYHASSKVIVRGKPTLISTNEYYKYNYNENDTDIWYNNLKKQNFSNIEEIITERIKNNFHSEIFEKAMETSISIGYYVRPKIILNALEKEHEKIYTKFSEVYFNLIQGRKELDVITEYKEYHYFTLLLKLIDVREIFKKYRVICKEINPLKYKNTDNDTYKKLNNISNYLIVSLYGMIINNNELDIDINNISDFSIRNFYKNLINKDEMITRMKTRIAMDYVNIPKETIKGIEEDQNSKGVIRKDPKIDYSNIKGNNLDIVSL